MPFIPQQPQSGLDTEGLRKHGEEQFREVARAWTEVDKSIADAGAALALLTANVIPAGTFMLFHQTTAPTGWTKNTTYNDRALRVVNGTVTAGGANAFSTVMAQTVTAGFGLTAGYIPDLGVSVSGTVTVYPAANPAYNYPLSTGVFTFQTLGWGAANIANAYLCYSNVAGTYTSYMQWPNGMSGTATGSGSGTGVAHAHGITMNVLYIDVILASKNAW